MLVSSRLLLRIDGEHALPVPPLAVPDLEAAASIDHLRQSAAVQLFAQRGQAISPSFALTATTRHWSRQSAGGWTVCPWRSSSPRRESITCRCRCCGTVWIGACRCSQAAVVIGRSACKRCETPSPGRTTSSPRTNNATSGDSRSSLAAARCEPLSIGGGRRRLNARSDRRTRRCQSAASGDPIRMGPHAIACWKRSATSPRNNWRRAVRRI